MSKTEEYRANAAECLRCAREVGDRELRNQYQQIAVAWLALAEMEAGLAVAISYPDDGSE